MNVEFRIPMRRCDRCGISYHFEKARQSTDYPMTYCGVLCQNAAGAVSDRAIVTSWRREVAA